MSGLKKSQHLSLPFKDIEVATNNFETCIGKGGFGRVYKGQLFISGKLTTVAVKRLNEQSSLSGQGLKEFLTEIELLTGQQHPNLISLLGYCDQGKEKIIVYEYAERGSLDQYIRVSNTTYTLTWLERLKICIDAACGLDHLHRHVGKHQSIIHRDVKSANILLDENWVAKISDLGLSKLSLSGLNRSAVISNGCGTRGYWEPEYIISGIVTKKSDVYSFGMVLFEVLCGKLCNSIDQDGFLLSAKLAKECYENNKLHEIIDASLREQMSSISMRKFSAIAYRCLHDDREQRPTMVVVKKELEETLEIQLSLWDDGTTEAAPTDTEAVADQPIPVPPALQIDELKISQTKMLLDDIVIIKQAQKEDEATVITINCPDKIGLCCDLCHTILFFDLSIVRSDVSTDGKWCYIVFWVIGKPGIIWSLLKKRLSEACPSVSSANILIYNRSERPKSELHPYTYNVEFCCYDQRDLLHDVTSLLCELEVVIRRVKVSTNPDGMVMYLLSVTLTRELAERSSEICHQLKALLGDAMISYHIETIGLDLISCSHGPASFIPPAITEDTSIPSNGVSVKVDNSFSPSHTHVRIVCLDRKGLLYDITRTLKDHNMQISYGRFIRRVKKAFELEFFILQADGKKIVNLSSLNALCSRIRSELFHPIRVELVDSGPDTELRVANPVELCGKRRPLVFYDIILAFKMLDMEILSAEICSHLIGGWEWEVHRLLLDKGDKLSVPKGRIEETVRDMLMGWDRS